MNFDDFIDVENDDDIGLNVEEANHASTRRRNLFHANDINHGAEVNTGGSSQPVSTPLRVVSSQPTVLTIELSPV